MAKIMKKKYWDILVDYGWIIIVIISLIGILGYATLSISNTVSPEEKIFQDPNDIIDSNITFEPPLSRFRSWRCYNLFNSTDIDCLVNEMNATLINPPTEKQLKSGEGGGSGYDITPTNNWQWYRCSDSGVYSKCMELMKFERK